MSSLPEANARRSDKTPPLADLLAELSENASNLFRKELLLARVETARDVTVFARGLKRPLTGVSLMLLGGFLGAWTRAVFTFVALFIVFGLGFWFSLVAGPLLSALGLAAVGYYMTRPFIADDSDQTSEHPQTQQLEQEN